MPFWIMMGTATPSTMAPTAPISIPYAPFGTTRLVPSQKQQSAISTAIFTVFVSPAFRSTFA